MYLSPEELTARRSRYPVGRESTEEEIAEAVYFLGCDKSASITGTDLTVDSGLTACLCAYFCGTLNLPALVTFVLTIAIGIGIGTSNALLMIHEMSSINITLRP